MAHPGVGPHCVPTRRPHARWLAASLAVLSIGAVSVGTPTLDPAGEVGPVAVPVGFVVAPYTHIGGAATGIAFGPGLDDRSAVRLYTTDFVNGRVVVVEDLGGVGGAPATFASGFSSPLGVVVDADGRVFVSDSETRDGPFGQRAYGNVWRLDDPDGDGVLDRTLVLTDLPNGRHNTNNLVLGADGLLYVTNGNATDDGVEGGAPEVPPWSGSVVRIDPDAVEVSVTDLDPATDLVATGMRNDYDAAFSPVDPSALFITVNGVDDAREGDAPPPDDPVPSDDLLYLADVDDTGPAGRDVPAAARGEGHKRGFAPVVEDFGFPSCLYNVELRGDLEPFDNPNPQVIEQFGPCDRDRVPRPLASFGAHPSANGLAFQVTDAWGEDFRHDLFVAEFGNFFGDEVVGHRVVRVRLDDDGRTVLAIEDFLTGVTPLDVAFGPDGDLYVADFTGLIQRVTPAA